MSYKEYEDNVLSLAKDWCSDVNSETFTSLLQELIFHLSGKHKDEVFRLFQKQLQKLRQGCSYDSLDEADEFSIAEEIKNKIASSHGEREANRFSGIYRHLRGCTLLTNLRNTLAFMQRSAVQESADDANSSFDSQNLSLRNITIRSSSQASRTPFASTIQRHPDMFDTVSSLPSNFASNTLSDAYHSSRAISYAHDLPQGTIAHLNGCPVVMPVPPPSRNPYKMSVSETVLIQELIYCFQGIGGKILIEDPVSQGFKIDPKVDLRPSVRQQVLRLAEVGWLHNQVRQFCDATRPAGLVNQSLVAALHDELTEYYRLIAVLQSRLQKQSEAVVDSPLAEEQLPSLTLSQLAVCVRSPTLRLQLLLSLAEACRGRRGGALASCVHSFLQHGDPNLRRSVRTLLAAVCRPMYVMLSRWILDGELEDPYNEFFIAANPDVKGDRLWHDKYYVQEALVPSFISLAQARKILATGKSINFLREVCQDHTPIKGREALRLALESTNVEALFVEDQDGELQAMLEQAYRETSRRVLDVLNTQYKFMDHLQALRRYLLLGQGDFIRHLMELLEPELAKPASQLYPHCLSGILDSAVRSTNAQYEDEDILQRLDVRLLEMSKGDTGWDVFTLDYHVVGPIGTVFAMNMSSYLMLFNALWRAKRMEFVLSLAVKRQLTAAKQMRCLPGMKPLLQRLHLLISEMVHFVHQVQYYTLFEVLECSWEAFNKEVQQAEGLDDVIRAHDAFLATVRAGAFLDEGTQSLAAQLRSVYDLMLQLQGLEEQLHNRASVELEARKEYEKLVEKSGTNISMEERESTRVNEFTNKYLPHMRTQLSVLAKSYQDLVKKFLLMLTSQPELTLQLLSFRLDFNEHYRRSDSRLNAPLTYQHRRLSELGGKHLSPTCVK
ncbi:gamma-tubulin complex component 3-like isoform X1 [Schistocerca cancellata]|uniref:gamma-tubulin complex component 3-like isoform X1 n=1 Tax=Schistocerca cancellata TaxID=274614 RepID=UPI0021190263|nr:gamma-tubulin complex component 3-like isoform X1 [Schistocerca cancellata]XP_049773995.1 gamma-tubulin complex component 3-like isoform X1 [Schistocerca cancellata]